MNIDELFKLILSNPTNLNIKYSSINGQEKLTVNGEEVLPNEDFDDTKVKELVEDYHYLIDSLDDCLFVEGTEEIEQMVDIKRFSKLMEQDSYTKEEAEFITGAIDIAKTVFRNKLIDKIQDYEEILKHF